MKLINANNFNSYDQAYDTYYNGVVPKYGATRMEWGFGKWLFIEHAATVETDTLAFWGLLDHMGILTADGRKRLARAKKAAERGDLCHED